MTNNLGTANCGRFILSMRHACSSPEIDRMLMLLRLPGDKFFGSLNRMGASFSIDFMQVLKRKKRCACT
jgi:hypothetical protein